MEGPQRFKEPIWQPDELVTGFAPRSRRQFCRFSGERSEGFRDWGRPTAVLQPGTKSSSRRAEESLSFSYSDFLRRLH